MTITAKFQEASFRNAIATLAKITKKEISEVIKDQAALFTMDAMELTPPFGNAPNTEGLAAQEMIGKRAIEIDVNRAFRKLEDMSLAKTGRLSTALERLADRHDTENIEQILRGSGWQGEGVVVQATAPLLEKLRNSQGRVRVKAGRGYVTIIGHTVDELVKDQQAKSGMAKAGWVLPLRKLKGRRAGVPKWISKHKTAISEGYYAEKGTGTKFSVTVGNFVGYVQRFADHIERRAWINRFRNIQKQLEKTQAAIARKLKKA